MAAPLRRQRPPNRPRRPPPWGRCSRPSRQNSGTRRSCPSFANQVAGLKAELAAFQKPAVATPQGAADVQKLLAEIASLRKELDARRSESTPGLAESVQARVDAALAAAIGSDAAARRRAPPKGGPAPVPLEPESDDFEVHEVTLPPVAKRAKKSAVFFADPPPR